jgi:hypothetical protein
MVEPGAGGGGDSPRSRLGFRGGGISRRRS